MSRLKPLWLELGEISRRVRAAESLAVACDYDGTLTPIVSRPAKALLPERARDALERLAARADARVAVLSGRALDDLERAVDLTGIFLGGLCGNETRDSSGRRETHLPEGRRIPPELRATIEQWRERFTGTWTEDKHRTLTLHYRALDARRHAMFTSGVRRRVAPFGTAVELVPGKRVIEVMPRGAKHKSFALQHWLGSRRDAKTLLFYFGDDTNDEPALEWTRRRGGLSVAVARHRTHAEFALASTDEVVWFLEWLDREWTCGLDTRATDERPGKTG